MRKITNELNCPTGMRKPKGLRKQWKAMNEFARKTDDILAHIADVLKPKSINDLAEAEFDEN